MHDSVHLLTLRAFIAVGNLKGVRTFFFKIRVFFFFFKVLRGANEAFDETSCRTKLRVVRWALPNHSTTPHDHTGRFLPCTQHKLRTKLKTGTSANLLLY